MTPKIDSALHAAISELPALPFMRLVRQDNAGALETARQALIAGKAPNFSYAKAQSFELDVYQRLLADFASRIDDLAPNATVASLYKEKTEELATRAGLIGCVQQGDDAGATAFASTLYGQPVASEAELEEHLAEMIAGAGPKKTRVKYWIDSAMFAEMAKRLLAHYGMDEARVRVLERRGIKVGHNRITHALRLLIPTSLRITRRRARQLLAHEIEAHALRHYNGVQGPLHILARGSAGYLATDEGLAMKLQQEYTQGNHWPGFWESYAVTLALKHDGPTTFALLRKARTAYANAMQDPHAAKTGEDAAWRLCLRIYQGISCPDTPGFVFPRDHVYLSGYRAVSALPELNSLYVGKIRHEDAARIAALGIAPLRTPERMSEKIVSEVVDEMGTLEAV